jgi:hypothetical protein
MTAHLDLWLGTESSYTEVGKSQGMPRWPLTSFEIHLGLFFGQCEKSIALNQNQFKLSHPLILRMKHFGPSRITVRNDPIYRSRRKSRRCDVSRNHHGTAGTAATAESLNPFSGPLKFLGIGKLVYGIDQNSLNCFDRLLAPS